MPVGEKLITGYKYVYNIFFNEYFYEKHDKNILNFLKKHPDSKSKEILKKMSLDDETAAFFHPIKRKVPYHSNV